MTNKHLNDDDIQQYVLQKEKCDIDVIEHIQHCENCKIKVEQYQFLFEKIGNQEKPVFDFDLANLVVHQLPKIQHKISYEKPFYYFIIFITVIFCCIVFYLFGDNLLNLFRRGSSIVIGLIITTVVVLSVFLYADLYRRNKTQMDALDFY